MSTKPYGLLDPAILHPDQHPAIWRIIRDSMRSKLELPYWFLALAIAVLVAWRVYAMDSLPYLSLGCEHSYCGDPWDPDSVRTMNEGAFASARSWFLTCLTVALELRIAALLWGSLLVAIFSDTSTERVD